MSGIKYPVLQHQIPEEQTPAKCSKKITTFVINI